MHIQNCNCRQALGPRVTIAFFIMSHFSPVCVVKPGFFLDRLKKTQGRKNSSLMKITQNSSKKLKVSAKFGKKLQILTPTKGKYTVIAIIWFKCLFSN